MGDVITYIHTYMFFYLESNMTIWPQYDNFGGEGGVQRVDCAKFTLTVSYNGNAIIKDM